MKNLNIVLKTLTRNQWVARSNIKIFMLLLPAILLISSAWVMGQVLVQNQLSDCVYTGDINGDNIDDIITINDRKITVSKPDAGSAVLLTHTFPAKVKRLIIGDFANSGRERGKKQIAAILDNGTTQVFAIGDDGRSLWWWFTQSTFIEDSERFTVGNFDGDIAEEIMVHNPATGRIRFFKKGNNRDFSLIHNFEIGNLAGNGPAGTSLANTQILVGSFFDDHPGRKDLMVIDYNARQLRVYGSVLLPNGNLTFWWAFTTHGNLYPEGSQLCVANLDGGIKDGLIIRKAGNGTYSLFKVEYGDGNLVQETSVNVGQLPVRTGDCRLVAAKVRDQSFRNERGGTRRDDILLFQTSNNRLTRTDARASGTNMTYWWAYNKTLEICASCPVISRANWFNALNNGLSTASVRINNFTSQKHEFNSTGERAFLRPNDSFFSINTNGRTIKLPFSIDMVEGGPENRCKAYINDWNSNSVNVSIVNGRVMIRLGFESEGTELVTDCYNNGCCGWNPFCPVIGCPDYEFNNACIEMYLTPVLSGGRLTYSSEVLFKVDVRELGDDPCSGNFWAFLCDWGFIPRVGDRQNKIRNNIETRLLEQINNPILRQGIEALLNQGIQNAGVNLTACNSVIIDNAGNLVFR